MDKKIQVKKGLWKSWDLKTVCKKATIIILGLVGVGILCFFSVQEESDTQIQTIPNLKLLNSHSQPEAGDEWVVSFETMGNADLTITPTDLETIGDLDFISLTCEGKEKTEEGILQVLAGDAVFYSGWQCDGREEVIHLVNIARKHTLKFQFGDKAAFAYNDPDSVTDTFEDESKIDSKENITVSGGQVYLATCGDNGAACSAGGECCSGNCVDDVCCNNGCTGLCKTCSSDDGGAAGTCHNTNDNYDLDDECAGPSYDACSNQFTRMGPDGYCDGAGACDTNDYTAYVLVGYVCYNGSSVNPSDNANCGLNGAQNCFCGDTGDNWYQCDVINNCHYDQYYVGFNESNCTETGKVARAYNQLNPYYGAGGYYYRCKTGSTTAFELHTSIMDTLACSSTNYCKNICAWYTGKHCGSGKTCSLGYGGANCSSTQYCSGGSCVSGDCAAPYCSQYCPPPNEWACEIPCNPYCDDGDCLSGCTTVSCPM